MNKAKECLKSNFVSFFAMSSVDLPTTLLNAVISIVSGIQELMNLEEYEYNLDDTNVTMTDGESSN